MRTRQRNGLVAAGLTVAACLLATTALAREAGQLLNFYGLPGMIDLPTAESMPDAELGMTVGAFDGTARGTLAFQVTPRLTASFRYSRIEGLDPPRDALFDRSFDLHFRFLDETEWRPAMAIGLRDLAGTGVYSSEYIVATKHLGDFAVSAGLGWGRLATRGEFANPFGLDDRPGFSGEGGEFSVDQWFRGPAAAFAGVSWAASDRLTLMAEYSSDAYEREEGAGIMEVKSPFNLGLRYTVREGTVLGLSLIQGSEIGVSASFTLNPKRPPGGGQIGPAPLPVAVRPEGAAVDNTAWAQSGKARETLESALTQALAQEGLALERFEISGTHVHLGLRNERFDVPAQAIGRATRILAAAMPPSVETFSIEPLVEGQPMVRVTLRRSDVEQFDLAPDGARKLRERTVVADSPAGSAAGALVEGAYPRFQWGIGPYIRAGVFDPDSPLRLDTGIEATGRYDIAPGLSVSGALRFRVAGNLDDGGPLSDSALPRVRTDGKLFAREGDNGIEYLTLDHFAHPAENIYTRLSVGYLEEMFGGVSGEILWKPIDSRLGLGAELNYAVKRDYDKLLGFQDYDILTGHVSAYYDIGHGFDAQLDVGRYLAGDVGATFSLNRTFDNGWRVGAFATLTDVSAEEFGEGSFDKGIMISVPLTWATGTPSRQNMSIALRPITRDGGARLNIRNRLEPLVREYQQDRMDAQWGLFSR